MIIKEFSYTFLYLWHGMELYDKHFFINENCMIRSFGQQGMHKACYGLNLPTILKSNVLQMKK